MTDNIRNYAPRKIDVLEEIWNTGIFEERQRNIMPLSETSLNRMMEHGKTGLVVISANRSEIDSSNPELSLEDEFQEYIDDVEGADEFSPDRIEKERDKWLRRRNAHADTSLRRDIRSAGFSYTPVFGGYHGQDSTIDSYEPSYAVYCYGLNGEPRNFQDLKQFAIDMCNKYRQESVYVHAPGEPPKYFDGRGNQVNVSSTDRFKFNRGDEEFFTTTRRDKIRPQRFTADIQFESMYIPLRPADLNEKMRRTKQGEYIL